MLGLFIFMFLMYMITDVAWSDGLFWFIIIAYILLR